MAQNIESLERFREIATREDAVLFYFSNNVCGACDVLEEKAEQLLAEKFPEMKMYTVNTIQHPDIAGQNRVFAAPTLLLYFGGREHSRFSRTVGLGQLETAIRRPYQMIFSADV